MRLQNRKFKKNVALISEALTRLRSTQVEIRITYQNPPPPRQKKLTLLILTQNGVFLENPRYFIAIGNTLDYHAGLLRITKNYKGLTPIIINVITNNYQFFFG